MLKFLKSRVKILVCVLILILVFLGIYISYRIIRHEKYQNENIKNLQASILKLNNDLEYYNENIKNLQVSISKAPGQESNSKDNIFWLEDGYNYLAIGNSITKHGKTTFWWNEVGMAAQDERHDYFHLVKEYLKQKNDCDVIGIPVNFSVWESQSHDRDETLSYIEAYLSDKLNLITIQLAENAKDLTTYKEDYISLINYIKLKAPNARVIVIGDFWNFNNRNDLKISAAKACGVEYVSLEEIVDNQEYQCGIGTIVYDSDGKEHIVEHNGVAIHPGNKGMKAIADKIIKVLDQ